MNKDNESTRRLNSEEVNRKAKNKKTNASSETQVVDKVSSRNSKTKSKKQKKKFRDKHPRIVTFFKIILLLIVLLIIICAGIVAGAIWGGFDVFDLLGSDYTINMEDLVIEYENSNVYDADGNFICELSAGTKRRVVSLDEMSEYLANAYIAIEDERFYEHSGVDFKRTAAATVTYIVNGGSSSFGGSTITQQVVKNITGDKEDSALRKVKEMIKAFQVEHYLSKDQILELYLNLIFVGGEDVNGVALGAVYYFNKDVSELSLAECAYLAGINHSPNAYQPFKTYDTQEEQDAMTEKIKSRTETVLAKMLELGYITEEEYNSAVAEVEAGLAFSNGDTSTSTEVSYAVEAAIEEIIDQMVEEKEGMTEDLAEIKLYSGGYDIYVTQKTDIQTTLEEELSSSKYAYTSSNGQSSMASMVIIEPSTGYVVAASARNEDGTTQTYLGYYNLTTDMLKQTGSAIKPLAVTSPGLESGLLTASTMFYDGETTFPGDYTPSEWYSGYKGLISMRTATEISSNIPHVKALSTIGFSTGVEFLQSIGFTDVTGDEGLALALRWLY